MTDHDADWIPGLAGRLRVKPGSRVRLPADFDPGATLGVRKKDDGLSLLRRGMALLAEYQERLAAQENYGVLVVLQALDAAGKDSTIRHVMSGVNPQGVKVSSFKAPSAEELSHDYLWRHGRRLPARGEIGIFNRSHYEEVLVVRVHPELTDAEGLSREETDGTLEAPLPGDQRLGALSGGQRHPAGENVPQCVEGGTAGSLPQADRAVGEELEILRQRCARACRYWDDYQRGLYAQMLSHTSTQWAPWHVLPADHKWFTRVCAAAVIADTLIGIDPHYPVPDAAARRELMRAKSELEAETPPAAAASPGGRT